MQQQSTQLAFGERLVAEGLASQRDVDRASQVAQSSGRRLSETLVRLGVVPEAELAQSLAKGGAVVPQDQLSGGDVPDDLNRRFLRRVCVLPIHLGDGTVSVAMADPEDQDAAQALDFALGSTGWTRQVATFSDIAQVLAHGEAPDQIDEDIGLSGDDIERMSEGDADAPVIRLVQRLLVSAIDRKASDIHIEPMTRRVAVRFRIDGRLIEVEDHPASLGEPIALRIKVLAGLDIAETRLPQDGRLRITVRGRDVNVRVATSPIAHGESVVLRILGRAETPLDLERLGIPATTLRKLVAALERPHGILLVTGPTGSGKTTTLYAGINRLKRPDVKILTVEDPVEVVLDGINQVQVRPEIDLTYASALRAFLRQDPDVLMIGEIRDLETAEIAMRAALTGHLVLSTLHTNSAVGAFTRLADIGIEPYLSASTVIAAVAQRLVRALCQHCASSVEPSQADRALFGDCGIDVPAAILEPVGCPRCQQTGFAGRLPIVEIIEIDDAARDAIRDEKVEQLRIAPGETLLAHGLQLVAAGRTSIGEIRRAVQAT